MSEKENFYWNKGAYLAHINLKGKLISSMIDSWPGDILIILSAFFYLLYSKTIKYDGIISVVSSKIKNLKMFIILCNFLQSLLITLALKKHKETLNLVVRIYDIDN